MGMKNHQSRQQDQVLEKNPRKKNYLKLFFKALGPGLVTGAADDDPSGIATYSIAGAQLGTTLLWMSWFTWPLMASVQMMCARIGLVSGGGLAYALKAKLPLSLMKAVCVALFAANAINIAADLAGMADACGLLIGLNDFYFIILFGLGIVWTMVRFQYAQISGLLKWLTITLSAYIITAFVVRPDWSHVATQTFTIKLPNNRKVLETIVALLGTTISPYLFFWQASQEIEEKKMEKRQHSQKPPAVKLREMVVDTFAGSFLSNTGMFFIILTTALTLNRHGITEITTSRQVAQALVPLAGRFASLVYTVGIVTLGMLAIPTLAGSAAYAFAEVFNFPQGLNRKVGSAKIFYRVIFFCILGGIAIDLLRINPVRAMFWSAIINGLLAPFLLAFTLLVARDSKIMKGKPSPPAGQWMVFITTIVMFLAAIGMFVV